MRKIRYLLSNINVLNLILAGGLLFFLSYTLLPLFTMKVRYSLPSVKKPASAVSESKTATEVKNPSPSDYTIIADQNLFHPDRKIPEVKNAQKEAPLPKPEFVLTGTLISNNLKMAYLLDKKAPVNTPGRQNRQTALKVGDSLSGFVLKEIDPDKVVMQRGEEQMVVALNDPHNPKSRDFAAANAAGTAGTQPGASRPPSRPAQGMPTTPGVSRAPAQQVPFVPTETRTATGSGSAQQGNPLFNMFRRNRPRPRAGE